MRVTSLERTVIDSIADFTKIGGLEELLRCLALIPSLDEIKLLEVLGAYERGQLYQKAGYILEAYKEALSLSDTFFSECMKRSSSSKTYLFDKQDDFVFHQKWLLYAPNDLKKLFYEVSYYEGYKNRTAGYWRYSIRNCVKRK